MKVLFLDIDGVCNNARTPQSNGEPVGVDPFSSFLVARLVDRTGCSVVLSSTWRLWEEARNVVRKHVVDFIDVTPDFRLTTSRGTEIKAWLDQHPEVTSYAILDDNDDMLAEQMPNFFQTTWQEGLTEEIADAVEKHLTIK